MHLKAEQKAKEWLIVVWKNLIKKFAIKIPVESFMFDLLECNYIHGKNQYSPSETIYLALFIKWWIFYIVRRYLGEKLQLWPFKKP